jgi:hypothetical protein
MEEGLTDPQFKGNRMLLGFRYGRKEFLGKFFLFWMFCPWICQFLEQRVKVVSLMGRDGEKKSL